MTGCCREKYFDDYFAVVKEPLTTKFSWDDFSKISAAISKSYSKYCSQIDKNESVLHDTGSKMTISDAAPKKKWYQFWK